MNVSVLGYCWGVCRDPLYLKIHYYVSPLIGLDYSISHLGIQINDWIIHPLSNNNAVWVKEKLSERCFGTPCKSMYIGKTDKTLFDLINFTENVKCNWWSSVLWLYTFGLVKKRDCVSVTKEFLNFALGISIPKVITPNDLLKELENHGY